MPDTGQPLYRLLSRRAEESEPEDRLLSRTNVTRAVQRVDPDGAVERHLLVWTS
jgi:hypothetical protein